MATRREHFVTFHSPGTLFSETTTKPIDSWDPAKAAAMAEAVRERHGAIPYGFRFETRIVSNGVPDGEGGTLRVEPRTVAESGYHYLGGKLVTIDELDARNKPDERILRSNMRCNDWPIVVVVERRYRTTQPFTEADVIVDARGEVIERGDDPRHVAYRASKKREVSP